MQAGSSLSIASGKFIDLYSATVGGESIVLDGDITSIDAFDGVKEIDINKIVLGHHPVNAEWLELNYLFSICSPLSVSSKLSSWTLSIL